MRKTEIKLTDNPLDNIKAMVPLLDEDGRRAFSFMMYGYNMCNATLEKMPKKEIGRGGE